MSEVLDLLIPGPKKVEDYLNAINYDDPELYVPSDFALEFINFIKLVNGAQGEENLTPVLHFKMLDEVRGNRQNIINMLFRGSAKTTLLGEYLFLYIAVYGEIPGFADVSLALYVSDSIENGVKNMRKNLEYRWENSDFLRKYIPTTRFTDVRWEFVNIDGHKLVVKGYGAKALSLDTKVPLLNGSFKEIKDIVVGDYVWTPKGYQTKVVEKSEIFHRPMYRISLEDGRSIKVCEEHLNSIVVKQDPNNKVSYLNAVVTTKELLELQLQHVRIKKRANKSDYISHENLVFIKNTQAIMYRPKEYTIDPYVLGLLLGDGSFKKDGSVILHCHKEDFIEYTFSLPDNLGKPYLDKRNNTVISVAIKGVSQCIRDLGLVGHGNTKFIPANYLIGSIEQRIALLQGLMDSDGSIQKNGRMDFCSNSENLVDDVSTLVRSLGGTTKKRKMRKAFRIEIWIDINPCRLPRKAERFTGTRVKDLVAIKSVTSIDLEPSQCIRVADEDHEFLVEDYFRTHNTGVRGSKEMGRRPNLAVLDDLVSDEDAKSATVIASIEDTVYKAVNYALHPTANKIIWSGTPFNSKDPLYKAVESGAWYVNVYPVCEKFPCTPQEFNGAWEDRFTYKYVNDNYQKALKSGKIDTFNQELMLRIMSDEDRLIQNADIGWYKRSSVLSNKGNFNFYITTDFATSEKNSADFSVISVWALNNKNQWYWVDGICKKQLMDKNIDDLFNFAQQYNPQQVGIEVSGQQGGFIRWIQNEMLTRNIFFPLATENNDTKPGIRPNTNKMVRFQIVVPWFKMNRMYFPEERKLSSELIECMDELHLAAAGGFKSKHDDFIDTISMLASLSTWAPSASAVLVKNESNDIWEIEEEETQDDLDSYIV